MRLPLPQFLSLLVHSFTLIHSQREMVNDGGDCKPGLEIWICNGNLKPQQWKETRKKCLVSGSLHCSIEQEPVITSVAITTAARLTSSYLQHHYGTSHTSTAMWDYTYSRYDETCTTTCVPAESSPPRWQRGRPRQGGGGRVTENRLKGSDVWLRHMLSLLLPLFFFPPDFFTPESQPWTENSSVVGGDRARCVWHLKWTLIWKSRCFYSCEKIVQSGQLQWFEALTHCVPVLIAAHGNRTAQSSPWYRWEKILHPPQSFNLLCAPTSKRRWAIWMQLSFQWKLCSFQNNFNYTVKQDRVNSGWCVTICVKLRVVPAEVWICNTCVIKMLLLCMRSWESPPKTCRWY